MMGERPLYRYSDDEMQTIRNRIYRREDAWLDAVWDPILLDVHGVTLSEAGERGMEVKVSEYGIPWDQSVQIGTWAKKLHSMVWLNIGPSPVKGADDD